MNIKILSDSTCDLSPALIAQYGIGLIPLIVIKGDGEFFDGATIHPQDIFDHVAAGGTLCSTAARSVIVYQETFAKYAAEYDGVIHISIGSSFSSSYQNACLAAGEFDNVRVIDSQTLSSAQGLVVLKAWELAQTAQSLEALVQELESFIPKTEGSFVVDKLDYLAKGGRCSSATALGANLLNLKPCIEVRDGHMNVGKKYRGSFHKCLASYIKDRLADRDDIDTSNLILVYTTAISEDILTSVRTAIMECGKFEHIHEATAGCTISCHCGPGTLGIMFARK